MEGDQEHARAQISIEERRLMWEQEQKVMFCDVNALEADVKTYVLAMRAKIANAKLVELNTSFGGRSASFGGDGGVLGGDFGGGAGGFAGDFGGATFGDGFGGNGSFGGGDGNGGDMSQNLF